MSSLKMTVSGVRGIADRDLSDVFIGGLASGFARFLGNKKPKKILIGRDTRASGPRIRKALIEGLTRRGFDALDLGICPTPTVLINVRHLKAAGAVMITASHNPQEYNGLKFVNSDGSFLDEKQAQRLYEILRNKKFQQVKRFKKGKIRQYSKACSFHIKKVLAAVDAEKIRKAKFKVAIDPCGGTGAVITEKLLRALGCAVFSINNRATGNFPHDPEPKPSTLVWLAGLVAKTSADIGFTQDADGDRLAIVSEKAEAVSEENTLALALSAVLAGTKNAKVVTNLSTSRRIDDIAASFNAHVYKTSVGEANVAKKIRQLKAEIGGEGNGGVIYPRVNYGRDSLVAIALILHYMAKTGKKISELLRQIPQYEMAKVKLPCGKSRADRIMEGIKNRFAAEKPDLTDGIKISWPEGWVHARPSNTEPVIRIIAEARTASEAKRLIDRVINN